MDPPINPTLQEPGVRPPEPKSSPQPVTQPPVTPLPAPATVASSVDIERFSKNIARMVEEGGKALAAYMKPREEGRIKDERAEEITDMVKTLGHVMEYWLSDPQRTFDLQSRLARSYLDLWASTVKRMAGEPAAPVAKPDPRDKRFADPAWKESFPYRGVGAVLPGVGGSAQSIRGQGGAGQARRGACPFHRVADC